MRDGKKTLVKEIMTGSPVTLKPEETLALANEVISLGRIRHIPIIDNGRLVGILSARDLIGAATRHIFGLKQKSKAALLKTVLIKDVMKKNVVTVKSSTKIRDAARLMADKRIGCVPVMDNGKLVGLVSTTNLLEICTKPLTFENTGNRASVRSKQPRDVIPPTNLDRQVSISGAVQLSTSASPTLETWLL